MMQIIFILYINNILVVLLSKLKIYYQTNVIFLGSSFCKNTFIIFYNSKYIILNKTINTNEINEINVSTYIIIIMQLNIVGL